MARTPVPRALSDPHVVLALGAAAAVGAEAGYQIWTSDAWLFLEAASALAALVPAWRAQDRLRLLPLLGIVVALQVSLVLVHLGLGAVADRDSRVLFRWQGNALLRGDYPRSEYPIGAVLLFAAEAWIGNGTTRAANAFLMIPFNLLTAAAVWATRLSFAPWFAALIAIWPLNAYYWEFKFDLVPAALLASGLVLAFRGRWASAGVALGLGAVVKWTPGLTFIVLLVWLVASRSWRRAWIHGAAFVLTAALVYVPFLVWSPNEVLHAYTRQGGRAITAESVWYLLLRPFGLAHVRAHLSFSAGAPDWANAGATVLQALLVLAVLAAAVRVRGNLRAAVALAALAPVAFLLTNRIFSPQFIVVLFAAWAVAGSLVARSRVEQLALGIAAAGASFGNAFVFPFALPHYDLTWPLASLGLFALGLGATGWIARRALMQASPSGVPP